MKRILCFMAALFLLLSYPGRHCYAGEAVKFRPKRLPGLTTGQARGISVRDIQDSSAALKFGVKRDSQEMTRPHHPVPIVDPSSHPATAYHMSKGRKVTKSARDYLRDSEFEVEGFGLYAYVVFTRRCGSPRECETYQAVYRNYLNMLEPLKDVMKYDRDSLSYAVMYWMLDLQPKEHGPDIPIPLEHEVDSAAWFVKHYDYARASVLAGRAKLAGKGPFLFASTKLLMKDSESPAYLFSVDLSGKDSAGISKKFIFFDKLLIEDPSNWQSDVKWEGFRDILVTRINTASESVFAAFKVLCGKSELNDCCSKYIGFIKLPSKPGSD